ncbi:hypothetical protein AMJ80_01135 [bacterium SM23_31]|nr:MAG: hypothetical protein AMJ80_01135 [bacterium SM23_31]
MIEIENSSHNQDLIIHVIPNVNFGYKDYEKIKNRIYDNSYALVMEIIEKTLKAIHTPIQINADVSTTANIKKYYCYNIETYETEEFTNENISKYDYETDIIVDLQPIEEHYIKIKIKSVEDGEAVIITD